MQMVIGPILNRAGSYVFDTWTAGGGVNCGYPYRRIEDAIYARKVAALNAASSARVCQTIDEFVNGYVNGYGDCGLLLDAA
jgi:hypothetical protein